MHQLLGIHAPYTWDESTYLACDLADFAGLRGWPVSYLTYQAHERGVHHQWDDRVLDSRSFEFSLWCRGCATIVWFDIHTAKVQEAKKRGVRNILVPLWNRLTADDLKQLRLFDHVVTTNKAVHQWLKPYAEEKLRRAAWDCRFAFTDMPLTFGGKRLYVPISPTAATDAGALLALTLRQLLDYSEELVVTIGSSKGWSRSSMEALSELISRHPRRVKLLKRPTYMERLQAYGTHDWVFVPALRENSGLHALEACCAGRPVLTFEVEPFSSLFRDVRPAKLIPCDIVKTPLGVPQAKINAHILLENLKQIASDFELFESMRRADFSVRMRWRMAFEAAWQQLLDP